MEFKLTPPLKTTKTYSEVRAKDAERHNAFADLVFRSASRTKGFSKGQKKTAFLTQIIHSYGSTAHIPASSICCR